MYMYKSLSLIFLCKKKRLALTMHVFIKKKSPSSCFSTPEVYYRVSFSFLSPVKIEGGEGGGKSKFET